MTKPTKQDKAHIEMQRDLLIIDISSVPYLKHQNS
jgi:hypothetical protein